MTPRSRRRRSLAASAVVLSIAGASACAHEEPAARAGVGLVLARRGAHTVVSELVPGGPAATSGIAPGDTLLSVDGAPTHNRPLPAIVDLLVGPEGTPVELAVGTYPNGSERRVSLRRAPVTLLWVEPTALDAETLYVRIRGFAQDTPDELARILNGRSNTQTLVLDLRSNGGGELEPAIRTAELFLPYGTLIGFLDPVAGAPRQEYLSQREPIREFRDIFVLVDGDTAASAELFCLALREAGFATVVGERTRGHATVETRYPGSDRPPVADGVLHGPGGVAFDRVGIEPDLVPPVDPSRIYPPDSDPLVAWLLSGGAARTPGS